MYPNCLVGSPAPTLPGIDINVIPDKEAPIIPKATKYQGADLFAKKKVSLLAPLPVKYEIAIKPKKYNPMINKMVDGPIS